MFTTFPMLRDVQLWNLNTQEPLALPFMKLIVLLFRAGVIEEWVKCLT